MIDAIRRSGVRLAGDLVVACIVGETPDAIPQHGQARGGLLVGADLLVG
jgi:hypothetical protein